MRPKSWLLVQVYKKMCSPTCLLFMLDFIQICYNTVVWYTILLELSLRSKLRRTVKVKKKNTGLVFSSCFIMFKQSTLENESKMGYQWIISKIKNIYKLCKMKRGNTSVNSVPSTCQFLRQMKINEQKNSVQYGQSNSFQNTNFWVKFNVFNW